MHSVDVVHDARQVPFEQVKPPHAAGVRGMPSMGAQVPGTTSQAWQGPLHSVVQQTPVAQKELAHSVGAVHAVPGVFFTGPVLEKIRALASTAYDESKPAATSTRPSASAVAVAFARVPVGIRGARAQVPVAMS